MFPAEYHRAGAWCQVLGAAGAWCQVLGAGAWCQVLMLQVTRFWRGCARFSCDGVFTPLSTGINFKIVACHFFSSMSVWVVRNGEIE